MYLKHKVFIEVLTGRSFS